MDFRIADTFTDSLDRLTGEEQKSVKTTAFDLQLNPANPGMSFHRLDKAKDKSFWSVRVGGDLRLIVFERVRAGLQARHLMTRAEMFSALAEVLAGSNRIAFDFAVVDEAQDISVAQLRFLAALGGDRPNTPFFAGDLGQRIFQQPFSWKSLGVDIRGRSRTLRVNYRTSHQIRMQADRLLGPELSDVDGNTEERSGTISVFNGPTPDIVVLETQEDEVAKIGQWIIDRSNEGVMPIQGTASLQDVTNGSHGGNILDAPGEQLHKDSGSPKLAQVACLSQLPSPLQKQIFRLPAGASGGNPRTTGKIAPVHSVKAFPRSPSNPQLNGRQRDPIPSSDRPFRSTSAYRGYHLATPLLLRPFLVTSDSASPPTTLQ